MLLTFISPSSYHFTSSFPPLAIPSLLPLFGKTPKNFVNACSFHFLSYQNSIKTVTSTLLYPVVSSPVFTLLGLSAACDLVNDDSSSLKPFLYLATRALCWLSSYFTPCSFSIFAGSSSLDLFTLKLPQSSVFLKLLGSELSELHYLISFSSMFLNSIDKLMTPRYISVAHISPSGFSDTTVQLPTWIFNRHPKFHIPRTDLMICP